MMADRSPDYHRPRPANRMTRRSSMTTATPWPASSL